MILCVLPSRQSREYLVLDGFCLWIALVYSIVDEVERLAWTERLQTVYLCCKVSSEQAMWFCKELFRSMRTKLRKGSADERPIGLTV